MWTTYTLTFISEKKRSNQYHILYSNLLNEITCEVNCASAEKKEANEEIKLHVCVSHRIFRAIVIKTVTCGWKWPFYVIANNNKLMPCLVRSALIAHHDKIIIKAGDDCAKIHRPFHSVNGAFTLFSVDRGCFRSRSRHLAYLHIPVAYCRRLHCR